MSVLLGFVNHTVYREEQGPMICSPSAVKQSHEFLSWLTNSGSHTVESEAQANPLTLLFFLTASASSDKHRASESDCTTGNFSIAEVSCQVNKSQSDQLTSNSFYKMHQPHRPKPFVSFFFLFFLFFLFFWCFGTQDSTVFCLINIVAGKQTCLGALSLYWQLSIAKADSKSWQAFFTRTMWALVLELDDRAV